MKLKTYKDLDVIKEPDDSIGVGFDMPGAYRERTGYCCGHSDALNKIRQEATKLIKDIKKKFKKKKTVVIIAKNPMCVIHRGEHTGAIKILKQIFNIKEDDLKWNI